MRSVVGAVLVSLLGCRREEPELPQAPPPTAEEQAQLTAEIARAEKEAEDLDNSYALAARMEKRKPHGPCPEAKPILDELGPLDGEAIRSTHIARATEMTVLVSDDPDFPVTPGPAFQQVDRDLISYRNVTDLHGRPASQVLDSLRGVHTRPRAHTLVMLVNDVVVPKASSGDTFVPGSIEGTLYLFTDSKTPVCASVIVGESGAVVHTRYSTEASLLLELRTRAIVTTAALLERL